MSSLKRSRLTVYATLFICVAGLTALIATPAKADFIALDSTRVTGTQAYTSSLGMDFNVLAPIIVTQLGAYDSGQDGLTNPISVGIFDRTTQGLLGVSAVVTGANPLIGFSRFSDIPDFVLGGLSHFSARLRFILPSRIL